MTRKASSATTGTPTPSIRKTGRKNMSTRSTWTTTRTWSPRHLRAAQAARLALGYARMPIVDEKAPARSPRRHGGKRRDPQPGHPPASSTARWEGPDHLRHDRGHPDAGHRTTGGPQARSSPYSSVSKEEFPDEEEALEEEHRLGNYKIIEQIYKYIPEAERG